MKGKERRNMSQSSDMEIRFAPGWEERMKAEEEGVRANEVALGEG